MSHNNSGEIRLVNKIAIHFGYLPAEQAAAAVAEHVRRFWDPRMQRRLMESVAAETADLHPVASAAAALLL